MQIFKSYIVLHGAQIYAKKYRSVPYFHDILRVKKKFKNPSPKAKFRFHLEKIHLHYYQLTT